MEKKVALTTSGGMCIMCLSETTFSSLEHVFPEAIGGSLTVDRVCGNCNHRLGTDVDSHLTDHLLIVLRRRDLGLKGKKGRLPRTSIEGHVQGMPEVSLLLELGDQGQFKTRVPPRMLESKAEGETETKKIVVGDDDRPRLATIVNKIRARQGQAPLSLEEVEERYPVRSLHQPMVTFAPEIDLHDYRRGILKIVYQLAHRWLGDGYLQDPLAAILRGAIFHSQFSPEDFQTSGLQGQILLGNDYLPSLPIDMRAHHLAYLSRVGPALAVAVHVFDIFQACVVVSAQADKYAPSPHSAILLNTAGPSHREVSMVELAREFLQRS